ncbi:MAG TPA: YihY/virulence factor BrkB family protein [Terracidiphilus sp.]|jgi:membrane protein|nr:YihY/virulence factor BrkB family protein [Terracidiphilus sp.]
MVDFASKFRRALWLAIEHDVLNTAKAAAYSGMLMIFPTMVVVTTLLVLVPEGMTLIGEIRFTFMHFLPADTMSLLTASIQTRRLQSVQLVFSALVLSIFAGLGTMLTLMEGFRRAYRLPRAEWGFWERRLRALLLVPMVHVPLALATLVLVFGHQIEHWMIQNAAHELRFAVLIFWRMARWVIAMITSVTVLGALYHFGTRRTEHWLRVMPGAVAATLVWFPATLAFGWYVSRIANYSRVYGSFGAGIATLVWLYITSFSALLGAELNGVLFRERTGHEVTESTEESFSSLQ